MPYNAITGVWFNWTSLIQHNLTNTTDPIKTLVNSSLTTALPWFWPAIPFLIYLWLFILYNEAPSRFKFVFITFLTMVISLVMAASGLISDAIVNIVIFAITLLLSNLFKG